MSLNGSRAGCRVKAGGGAAQRRRAAEEALTSPQTQLLPQPDLGALRLGNRTTLARIVGVSPAAVTKAIRTGRIPAPGPDGLLDLRAAVQAWARNTAPGRVRARALRDVTATHAKLRERIAELEREVATLRAAQVASSASEVERVRAVSYAIGDALSAAVGRFVDEAAAGIARICERRTAAHIWWAVERGSLARLLDRYAVRAGIYKAMTLPPPNAPEACDDAQADT